MTGPRVMDMAYLAKLLGISTRAARTLFVVNGKGVAKKHGRLWKVTMAGLRAAMPDIYAQIELEAAARGVDLSVYR